MTDEKALSDDEAYERLHAALLALGQAEGETTRADTALSAARRALALLQFGLLKAMDDQADEIEGVIEPDLPSPHPPSS